MAVTVKSDQQTLIDANTKLEPQAKGKLNRIFASYTFDGTEVKDSTLELAQLPLGAQLDPTSVIHFEALGANTALCIGDASDNVKYQTSTATNAAGSLYLDLVSYQGGEILSGYESIFATVTGTGTPTADQEIYGYFYFVY